ncbi:hypothetical protein BC629DRAFT_888986 [Irpex lacteus]|nr:hypothetical protein BC629DRAFT_888986 [Irpex lacteus]
MAVCRERDDRCLTLDVMYDDSTSRLPRIRFPSADAQSATYALSAPRHEDIARTCGNLSIRCHNGADTLRILLLGLDTPFTHRKYARPWVDGESERLRTYRRFSGRNPETVDSALGNACQSFIRHQFVIGRPYSARLSNNLTALHTPQTAHAVIYQLVRLESQEKNSTKIK